MRFILELGVAFLVGAWFGVGLMAVLAAAGRADIPRCEERAEWASGSSVKHRPPPAA